MWWRYKPYVSVAQRRASAARQIAKMEAKGQKASPVRINGRAIANTFWGKAWCDNLESYSDYANRLPRGRTYVRNGSVMDLQIAAGQVTALVAGSSLYNVHIDIKTASRSAWKRIREQCAGQIGSLIELLQGKFSQGVMRIMTDGKNGLFPKPKEIRLKCSCPDWAVMCKHVAAVLYGVGARLDEQPELLFTLRNVDHLDLITKAGDMRALTKGKAAKSKKTIAANKVADVFGIELDEEGATAAAASGLSARPTRRRGRVTATTPAKRGPSLPVSSKARSTTRKPRSDSKSKSSQPAKGSSKPPKSKVDGRAKTKATTTSKPVDAKRSVRKPKTRTRKPRTGRAA